VRGARDWWWLITLLVERQWLWMRLDWLRRVVASDPLWAHKRVLKIDRDSARFIRKWKGEP
jgi:hypothetical protein